MARECTRSRADRDVVVANVNTIEVIIEHGVRDGSSQKVVRELQTSSLCRSKGARDTGRYGSSKLIIIQNQGLHLGGPCRRNGAREAIVRKLKAC